MKKYIITTLLIITLLIGGMSLFPHQAEAGWIDILALITGGPSGAAIVGSFWESLFSELGELALRVSSYILTLSGVVLNMAIVLTMNIKVIYEATPAIEQVWVVIRNISSIFIIFALLYISIRKILDVDSPTLGTMIKNIVIAGLLINFSLFFTRVAIDASNLLSMQFYRAIAPSSQNINLTDKGSISALLANSFAQGGISDVFMQSLKIPKIYNNGKGVFTREEGGASFKIIIASTLGSVLMITAALSFFAAAIAFVIRLIFLLLLMGFSPIFFVGMIFPDIQKNVSGKWWGYLEQQLIFMPIYLLFMYVALRFISGTTPGEGFFAALDSAQLSAGKATNSGWMLSTVGLVLQYAIAFILINIPLMAAQQTGGISVKWGTQAKDWVKGKVGSGAKAGFGFAAQHGFGRGAKFAQEKLAQSDFATRNPNAAVLFSAGLGKAAKGTFGGSKGGYDKRFKDFSKARAEFAKNIKISDEDKKAYVAENFETWDSKTEELGEEIKRADARANDMSISVEERIEAKKKAGKLFQEYNARNKAKEKKNELKYLEDQAIKTKKAAIADNLAEGKDFFTTKARKDAADAIRKEFSKSKEEKNLTKLEKFLEKDEEGGGEKGGKDEGGAKA